MRHSGRSISTAAVVAAVLCGLLGCSASVQEEPLGPLNGAEEDVVVGNASEPSAGHESDPNDVPEDDTDYSIDAGSEIKEYEYPDDPMPADDIVATLCNLNQRYLEGLRTVVDGAPVVSDELRTNLVGFSDLLAEWDGLRPHFPDEGEAIDLAHELYEKWDSALLSSENGDMKAASEAMVEAEQILGELPEEAGLNCR